MVEGALSSWRPPWLETWIASAPRSTARRASSTVMIPFRTSLRGQSDRTQRIVQAQERLELNEAKLAEAQQIARLGSWEWEIATDRVDWRDKFRIAFDGVLRGEVSWARPNRRFTQHGMYLPGWRRTGAGQGRQGTSDEDWTEIAPPGLTPG